MIDCICYIFDKNASTRFSDFISFSGFDDMDNYIALCEEYGFLVERIVDVNSDDIYYNVLPEDTVLCFIP